MGTWPQVLGTLAAGQSLSANEASWVMERIMAGEATGAQFGAFVLALREKGETSDEILGLARVMRDHSVPIELEGPLLDTCGTGGDRAGTINVSTLAALVAAGLGARVVKHGNRSASSLCGSADLLEELGVKIDLSASGVARCVDITGIGFCFAPVFHPAMRHASAFRTELGVRTVFNFLGPLTNPARAERQTIGVSEPLIAPRMADALRTLGSERVLLFTGPDGLDEIATSGPTKTWELNEGKVVQRELNPAPLGFTPATPEDIRGGPPELNARLAIQVLDGEPGPRRDIVVLNSAAALVVAGLSGDIREGVAAAEESIDSSRARRVLKSLVEASNR